MSAGSMYLFYLISFFMAIAFIDEKIERIH